MIYPLVCDLADDQIPVSVTCRGLGFSPQGFYAWCKHPYSDRDWDDAHLLNLIVDIHQADPEFGYRFIADELDKMGIVVSENRVQRLCQSQQIASVVVKRRQSSKVPGPAVHDDLVQRDFTATRPNELWLTDISEHPTRDGKLYLCAVVDVFSKRVVGYSIADRMTADLAVTALQNAVTLRGPVGTVLHSDRGSQFRSDRFVAALAAAGLVGSMGRVGAAGDNAAMESFFALVQLNVLNRRTWDTRQQLRLAIVTWIEATLRCI
jgi:transposase InsO family protein